jgi:hypothetical protein
LKGPFGDEITAALSDLARSITGVNGKVFDVNEA